MKQDVVLVQPGEMVIQRIPQEVHEQRVAKYIDDQYNQVIYEQEIRNSVNNPEARA